MASELTEAGYDKFRLKQIQAEDNTRELQQLEEGLKKLTEQ